MSAKKKNKVVRAWVDRQINDHYVQMSHKDGYRSRAAYKLLEIDKNIGMFQKAHCVVDLGCAPGSWLQVVKNKIGVDGLIVGVDLLEMEPIAGVTTIMGDFTESDTLSRLVSALDGRVVDLVLSDMSTNLSGIKMVDQARGAHLVELALEFAKQHLKVGGVSVIKIFHGGEFARLVKLAKTVFTGVDVYKPDASRGESCEVYLICKNLFRI